MPIASPVEGQDFPKMDVRDMTLNFIRWRGSSSGALESVESLLCSYLKVTSDLE